MEKFEKLDILRRMRVMLKSPLVADGGLTYVAG